MHCFSLVNVSTEAVHSLLSEMKCCHYSQSAAKGRKTVKSSLTAHWQSALETCSYVIHSIPKITMAIAAKLYIPIIFDSLIVDTGTVREERII